MNILKQLHDFFVPHARNNYIPHALGHRSLSFYAAAMIAAKLFTLVALGAMPAAQAFSSAVTPDNILQLTNLSRQAYGLSDLKINGELDIAAQAKADDMLKYQYFQHVSPSGVTPWDFIKARGYNYIIAGENLAINFYSSESVEDAWMNSPGHKANILNKDFEDIGVGIAQGTFKGSKAIFVVEMFGSSIDQPITPKNNFDSLANASAPTPIIELPMPVQVSLNAPIIENNDFNFTDKKQFMIQGYAPGANTVYLIVNQAAVAKVNVIENHFSAVIALNEGLNAVSAVAYNSQLQASTFSKAINVKVDTIAPSVVAANISAIADQQKQNSQNYLIEVQTQGDASKVLARLGKENILLQPTQNPDVWQGIFSGDISELQGKFNISAFDLAGNSSLANAGIMAGSLVDSFGFNASPQQQAGFNLQGFSVSKINALYAYFVVFLLAALILAIAVRRHIQDIGMIAQASAMVAVIMIFWVT